MNINGLD